ncbi:MAG: ribosome assembly RNA-binding protein YhbY [Desulfuromonas sp.]|nr:ribosome assembly RNA-binding protein YhbY [Desulfuromonas sp.]
MSEKLTGKQNRFLRGLGHHLSPVVMVGKDAVSEGLINSVEEALEQHELIKIKLLDGCMVDRREVAETLAVRTDSAVAQVLGRTILLFRSSEKKLISLPKA